MTDPERAEPRTAPPSEEELARIATPATVRRAPRYGPFIMAGTVLGIVIGAFLGSVASAGILQNRTTAVVMSALGLGLLGALSAAGLAVWVDHRSSAR